jgi:hypothetical protein
VETTLSSDNGITANRSEMNMTSHHPSLPAEFVLPAYGSTCFSGIPATLRSFLTGDTAPGLPAAVTRGLSDRYDCVVFFLIDALGWSVFEPRRSAYPILRRFENEGRIVRLTAQFPSTTTNHVTTIHTGLPIGRSGVFDWQYYEPAVDDLIVPLLFSTVGTRKRETLQRTGIDANAILPTVTLYQTLAAAGVQSHVFQHRAYTPSTYSNAIFRGASVHPYKTLPEALVNLTETLSNSRGTTYCFLYFDRIDDIGHEYGPHSPQVDAEIDTLLTVLERQWLNRLSRNRRRILWILSADHGHIAVDPTDTCYLNLDPDFSGLNRFIRPNRQGRLLWPGGSARNPFLYIRPECLDEAQVFLTTRLEGRAGVYRFDELSSLGLFGPWPSVDAFRERAGNLWILPYGHHTIWWYERDRSEMTFRGHHGGLSAAEMEIPLLILDLD